MRNFYDLLSSEGQEWGLFCHSSPLLIRRVLKEENRERKVTICDKAMSL